MNSSIFVRAMTPHDIEAISDIHATVLPTVTARIGKTVLRVFYGTLLRLPDYHRAFVAEQDGLIAGAITGTLDSHRTSRALSWALARPALLFSAVRSLFSGTIRIQEIIERKKTEDALHALTPPPYRTILTLVVEKKSQHKGIGTRLLKTLEQSFPKRSKLCVDTECNNTDAQRFYERNGFMNAATIHESILYTKQLS